MKFTPQSDEEIYNLIPEGEHDGYVKEACHHVGKSKKESIKLTIQVWHPKTGVEKLIYVFLTPSFQKILKHFCKHTENIDKFDKGDLTPEDCVDRTVRMKLAIDVDDTYGTKNVVVDFVAPNDSTKATAPAKKEEEAFDDDIPF